MEQQALEQYNLLTREELRDLNYTGDWELDKKRFTKEFEKNFEVLNMDLESLLDEGEDY